MTSEETARLFVDFAVRMKRFFRSGPVPLPAGLTEERCRTLHFLEAEGGAGLRVLSERIGISPSSLCIMLGKLEEDGFVARRRDESDRRGVRYACTEEGLAALEREQERKVLALNSRFKSLSDEERDALAAAMSVIDLMIEKLDIPRVSEADATP